MDNLRHMVLQSTKAIDTRKTKLRDVMDANEPLYWPRKARHAFERWRRQTHPHKVRRHMNSKSQPAASLACRCLA